jgi:hypothetical protein
MPEISSAKAANKDNARFIVSSSLSCDGFMTHERTKKFPQKNPHRKFFGAE